MAADSHLVDQYAAICMKRLSIEAFTVEDEYKVLCDVSNSATFDDLE